VSALDRIEQCISLLRIRREDGPAGRYGREQGGRNALRAQCCWT
jgi:hypothetical protein